MENNLYDAIAANTHMTDSDIRSAYKKAVRIYQENPEKLAEIQHAYQTLRTTRKRTQYDAMLALQRQGSLIFSYDTSSHMSTDIQAVMTAYLWDSYFRFNRVTHNFSTPDTLRNIFSIRAKDVMLDVKENIKEAQHPGLSTLGCSIRIFLSAQRGVPADLLVNPMLWHVLAGAGTGAAMGMVAHNIVGPARTAASLLANTASKLALLAHEKLGAYTPSPLSKSITIANVTKLSDRFAYCTASLGCAHVGHELTRMVLIKTARAFGL